MSRSKATTDDKQKDSAGENPPEQSKTGKRVEVICEDTLGPELLKKCDVTDDPDYVALLKTTRGRKLVREVK